VQHRKPFHRTFSTKIEFNPAATFNTQNTPTEKELEHNCMLSWVPAEV
jgi:hypothetical protein